MLCRPGLTLFSALSQAQQTCIVQDPQDHSQTQSPRGILKAHQAHPTGLMQLPSSSSANPGPGKTGRNRTRETAIAREMPGHGSRRVRTGAAWRIWRPLMTGTFDEFAAGAGSVRSSARPT